MFTPSIDRPYFDAWLRRTGRHLAVSGKLSEIALILASENGESTDHWRSYLLSVLRGEAIPSLDLLTRIDALLATPAKKPFSPSSDHQASWL